ncbi:Sporulation-specific protein 21 [Lasiodiplodia theobromae]|uniref:Sporulation-specific protein 21 n=1 Tax=Lasiodiplodia theobromae TaxID=45133 RepID=A0A5N5DJS1_9PEZI|nr:Sporulation-specific protein 21 [Lasiodiplodia theobromae]
MAPDTPYPPSPSSPTISTPTHSTLRTSASAEYVSLAQLQQTLEEHSRHGISHHRSYSSLPASLKLELGVTNSRPITPENGGVSLEGTPELPSSTFHDFDDDMDAMPQANTGGGGLEMTLVADNAPAQLTHRLNIVDVQLAEKSAQLEEKMREYQELKAEYRELKQEYKDIKQEYKDIKQEYKEFKEQSKQEYGELMDVVHHMREDFRKANEDRRMLQAHNLTLQNEILLLQGDMRFVLRNQEPTPASTGKKLTPQAKLSVSTDVDITPTPSKAILAKTSPAHSGLVPVSDSASTPSSRPKASNSFNPGFGTHGPLNTSPALRERASFYQPSRFDDPFQQSPVQTPLSSKSSMVSLSSASHPSSENLHATPSKSRPTSKALSSTNWRQPRSQPSQPQLASHPQSPERADLLLQDARNQYTQLLAKIETWADVFCGTIHTSVRSKEQRAAEMVKTLGSLVGNFDLEKIFNKLEFRTLLVTAYANRRVFERLFADDVVLERFGAETVARLLELNELEADTPPRDPARHREIASDKAQLMRAAFSAPGAWRAAEAKATAADLCNVLSPIIPISERASGVRQMEGLVEEAIRVVGALRGIPARSWHLAFDAAGSRVSLATMSVRGSVESRQSGGGAGGGGASLEEDHAVMLGVTPHLVSKLWTPGGVAPEELVKAEVLTHPVGRSFFAQH